MTTETDYIGSVEENSMQKKEKILVAVTVIMVIILGVCLFYDRTSALMARTLSYDLPEGAKVVDIDKHGFLFYRIGYEAKVEINPEYPEDMLERFIDSYGESGRMLSGSEFATLASYMFDNYYSYVDIKPAPAPGSSVWMQEADIPGGHHVLHFLDIEEGDHSYLYIYYVR